MEFDEDDDDEDDDDLNDEDSEISVETQLREVDEKSQHNQSIEKVIGIIFVTSGNYSPSVIYSEKR